MWLFGFGAYNKYAIFNIWFRFLYNNARSYEKIVNRKMNRKISFKNKFEHESKNKFERQETKASFFSPKITANNNKLVSFIVS